MSDLTKDLVEKVRVLEERKLHEQMQKNKDFLIELGAKTYGAAMAYTNVIILGGYAGLFAIWGFVTNDLSADVVAITAILSLISVSFFVGFEVYKMIINSIAALKINELIKPNISPTDLAKAISKYQQHCALVQVRILKVWAPVLVITIGTGFGAVGILIYSFIVKLLSVE